MQLFLTNLSHRVITEETEHFFIIMATQDVEIVQTILDQIDEITLTEDEKNGQLEGDDFLTMEDGKQLNVRNEDTMEVDDGTNDHESTSATDNVHCRMGIYSSQHPSTILSHDQLQCIMEKVDDIFSEDATFAKEHQLAFLGYPKLMSGFLQLICKNTQTKTWLQDVCVAKLNSALDYEVTARAVVAKQRSQMRKVMLKVPRRRDIRWWKYYLPRSKTSMMGWKQSCGQYLTSRTRKITC